MKIIGIMLLVFISLMTLSLIVDLLGGFTLVSAISDMFTPLKAMGTIAYFILYTYAALAILILLVEQFKRKKSK